MIIYIVLYYQTKTLSYSSYFKENTSMIDVE